MIADEKPPPQAPYNSVEAELRHYSPQEVEDMQLLPFSARTLRDKAHARQIPHSGAGGRVSFLPRHLRVIAEMYEVLPTDFGRGSHATVPASAKAPKRRRKTAALAA